MNPKSAPYNYPALVSRDEGGINTRSVTTTQKLETFVSQLKGVFTNEIENNVFDEEVKTDVGAELDQPVARARLNFRKVIPFDPDIHPDRIRFGEVTDILGKVNTRKACGTGPHHQQHHTLSHSYASHHSPGFAQHLRLSRLSPYGLEESMGPDDPQSIQKEIRPLLLQAHFPSLLPKQSVRSHHDQAVNELG